MRSEGWVCVSVCPLSHISPMERLFVLKTLSRTQRATKVKNFVGFSLKPLRCRDPALPPLYGHTYSRPFFLRKARMRIIVSRGGPKRPFLCESLCSLISIKHVFLRRGFCTLVLSYNLFLWWCFYLLVHCQLCVLLQLQALKTTRAMHCRIHTSALYM